MSFDSAVTLVTLTFGKANGTLGEAATATMSVTPVFTGTRYLNWSATGNPWIPNSESVSATPGSFGSLSVPAVDQAGWVDEFGNAYKNWYYTVTVNYSVGGSLVTLNRSFNLLAGTGPIDVDVTLSSGTSAPQIVLAYPVKSVNGISPDSTGNITVAGGSSGATINDTTPSTTTVFSSSKTNTVATTAAANAASALISDTATDTTHVLSASKTIALIGSGSGSGVINDSTPSATSTYSANKTIALDKAATVTAGRGVNMAALDFWTNRGDNPAITSDASFAYAAQNGATKVRIPFTWELVQPTLYGALDPTQIAKLDAEIFSATSRKMIANIDVHNYMRYKTADGVLHILGDGTLVQGHLVDLWTRLAQRYASNPLVEFGLMNEPHDLPDSYTLGSELITNPTMETNITGWTAGSNTTAAQSTTQSHTGSASLALTATAAGNAQATSPLIAVTPGQQYKYVHWAKAGATARQTFAQFLFFDSNYNTLSPVLQPNSAFVTDSTSAWTQTVVTPNNKPGTGITAPTGAAFVQVFLIVNSAAAGETHYFDDVSFKQITGGYSPQGVWEQQAQACVTAIRGIGATNVINVAGYDYSAAGSYWINHPTWFISDPLNRSVPEAHYYADGSGSGTISYANTVALAVSAGFAATGALDALMVKTQYELLAFINGATNRGLRTFIGEIGWNQTTSTITNGTPAGNELALWNAWGEFAYQIFDTYNTSVTYWASGDTFAAFGYAFSIYLGVPNSSKSNVAQIVEAHYPRVSKKSLGLDQVSNTSDANKPVSTAQATLIALNTGSAPVPAVVGTYAVASATAQTTTGTSRIPYVVGVTGTNVRLTFTNWYSNASTYGDVDNSASIAVKASVERGGVLYPVTFGGKLTVNIDGGGSAVTDPLSVEITAGETLYVRTFITPTTNWYYNRFSYSSAGTGGWTVTSDLTTPGSAAVADTANKQLYGPSSITVEPTGAPKHAFQIIGDSIAAGTGDGAGNSYLGGNVSNLALGGGGFILRGLRGIAGTVQSAVASDTLTNFLTQTGHFRRFSLSGSCQYFINEYGRNDLSTGRTLAQIQADMISIWTLAAGRGKIVFDTTKTPLTTSTDGWVTTTAQTVASTTVETVRINLNTWLRSYAPMLNGVATTNGTPGAIYAGAPGHPLFSVFDAAAQVETGLNSGIWKARVNARTVTDAVTTAGGYSVTSATGAFTSADVGRTVTIAGAGTSGALYIGVILSVSGSSASLSAATPTAVSAATMTIGDSWTRDGTHPDVYGATQLGYAFAGYLSAVLPY